MNIKKILIIIGFIFSINFTVYAETPHYLDFKLILNESDAGKKAQNFLKKKLESGIANIKKKEKSFQEDEKKIIQQKKIISAEEYKKKYLNLEIKYQKYKKKEENYSKMLQNKEPKQGMKYLKI